MLYSMTTAHSRDGSQKDHDTSFEYSPITITSRTLTLSQQRQHYGSRTSGVYVHLMEVLVPIDHAGR